MLKISQTLRNTIQNYLQKGDAILKQYNIRFLFCLLRLTQDNCVFLVSYYILSMTYERKTKVIKMIEFTFKHSENFSNAGFQNLYTSFSYHYVFQYLFPLLKFIPFVIFETESLRKICNITFIFF